MQISKGALYASYIIEFFQLLIGGFFFILYGICTFSAVFSSTFWNNGFVSFFMLIIFILLTLGGYKLIQLGIKRIKLRRELKRYVAVLKRNSSPSISELAEALNTSEDIVKENLQAMVKRKFFSENIIDRKKIYVNLNSLSTNATLSPGLIESDKVFVECRNCGAINSIEEGKDAECEYCGSVL